MTEKHTIGLVFYPGMTALDIIGPQQVWSTLPGVELSCTGFGKHSIPSKPTMA